MLVSTIMVPHAYTIIDLDLQLDIRHSFDADLSLTLVSPAGERIQLASNAGGSGQDFRQTVLDDEATTAIKFGAAPFQGNYRPTEPLNTLDGKDISGTWTLEIVDNTPGDTGVLESWSITVKGGTPDNRPPVINAIGNQAVNEGSTLDFTVTATDPDRPEQSFFFSLEPGAPNGMTMNPITGALQWTPTESDGPATYSLTVRVTDNGSPALNALSDFTVEVYEANRAPSLPGLAARTVAEGTLLALSVSATDPDLPANGFTFSLDPGAPIGATINPLTGALTWVPDESQGPGQYPITVRVTDDGSPALSATTTFFVDVVDVNTAPILEDVSDQTVDEGQTLAFSILATDADLPASALTFSLNPGAPAGMSIHPTTGALNWVPGELHGSQSYSVTVRVADGTPAMSREATFLVTVNESNSAPQLLAISQQSVSEGAMLSLAILATDSDVPPNALTYSLDPGAPAGIAIDSTTGALTWIPTEHDGPGSFNVTVRATDNGSPALSTHQEVAITVSEVNRPPSVTAIDDRTVAEGTLLSINFSASDPDLPANSLTFALDPSAPPGATINPVTGAFSWAPHESQGAGRYPITVRVTDNGSPVLSATTTFFVDVTEVNTAPRLDPIENQNAIEGHPFSLVVHATDADLPANELSYSLAPGAPEGMSIDPLFGTLTWVPSFAQAGNYSVTVQVADDAATPLQHQTTFNVSVQNTTGPTINDFDVVISSGRATEIVLAFSAALDPAKARALANYSLISSSGKDARFGTADDRLTDLALASYDDATRTVRLTPSRPLKVTQAFALNAKGTSGLTDASGVPLDGNADTVPGGDYRAIVGTQLAYVDGNGDAVTLSLSKGGVMALTFDSQGDARELELIGTVAGKSTLSGKVKRPRTGGDGVTPLGTLVGAAGVNRAKLKTPPFFISNIAAAVVDRLLSDGTLTGDKRR
jgi:subtilisin-like proprotein convertase family protein